MKKRTNFLLTFAFSALVVLNAQNRVQFAYDQAGNRVKRELVITHNARSAKRLHLEKKLILKTLVSVRLSMDQT